MATEVLLSSGGGQHSRRCERGTISHHVLDRGPNGAAGWRDLRLARRVGGPRPQNNYRVQSAWYGRLQAPKSKSAVRTVPIPEILCDALRTYLCEWKPNPARLLFATRTGKPHTANKVVQRKLWPILDGLEIPRAGFHAFRHAASTLLIDLGATPATVTAQLGHSDPRITLSVYTHVIPKSQREAVEQWHQRF